MKINTDKSLQVTMTFLYIHFIILALLLNACSNSKDSNIRNVINTGPVFINLTSINPVLEEIKLSEFASSIEYIPLEYNEESMLEDRGYDIQLEGNNIFIKSGAGIKQFNLTGAFISNLFKVGRGPGECWCLRYAVDNDSSTIYVRQAYNRPILKFDYKNYSNKNSTKITISEVVSDIFYWNRKLFVIYDHSSNPPFFLKAIDIDNNVVVYSIRNTNNYLIPKSSNFASAPFTQLPIQEYEGLLLLKDMICDTIFQTKDLLSFEPRYILQFGSHKLTYEEYMNSSHLVQPMKKGTLSVLNFFETKHDIIFILNESMGLKEHFLLSFYNKHTKQIKFTYNGVIKNDIDNGPDIDILRMWEYNFGSYEDEFFLYTLVQPTTFINLLSNKRFSNIQALDTGVSANLLRIIKNINEMDNPVFMKIKLKSFD